MHNICLGDSIDVGELVEDVDATVNYEIDTLTDTEALAFRDSLAQQLDTHIGT